MNQQSRIIGSLGSILFLGLVSFYWTFVLDDSFIIYRYAQHLAHGQGLAWNIGQDPVEGYTSFLWVLLNALGILLQIDPVIFSKIISVLAAIAIIWTLAWASQKALWGLAAILVGAIALSPPFAFLTMQGLETALTAFLVLSSAIVSRNLFEKPTPKAIGLWFALVLLGALSRPDTIAFNAGAGLGLLLTLFLNRDHPTLRAFLLIGLLFAGLGTLYLIWRIIYFGNFLPTTYYLKLNLGRSVLKREGIKYIWTFMKNILLPYLVLAGFLFRGPGDKKILFRIIPTGLGLIGFGLYLLTVYPLQGHLWRFIFPVFPVMLLALAEGWTHWKPEADWLKNNWLSILMVLLYGIWTLHLLPATNQETISRTQTDRVLAGKALAGLSGTMLVSEAGALPYYSEWNSADTFGLTSEEVARHGLTPKFLASLNPDLVMIFDPSGKFAPDSPLEAIITQFLIENDFVAVAAIHKSLGQYHYYFARKDSPLFPETVSRLTRIPGVEYGDLKNLLPIKQITIYPDR